MANTPYYTKAETDALDTTLRKQFGTGYQGVILSTDALKTEDGVYVAGDTGTYTNNGSLVIDVSNTIVLVSIIGTQTVFEKVEIPITLTIESSAIDGNTNAISSGAVKDLTDHISYRENLFIYNRYSETLGKNITAYPPTETAFTFGFSILSNEYLNAKSLFNYDGNYAKLSFSTVSNGGLIIMKSDFDSFASYDNTLGANLEIYTPVAVDGTVRFNQITSSTQVTKGSAVAFSFSAGVNVLSLPPTTFDASFTSAFITIDPSSTQWDNQEISFGRLFLYSGTNDSRLDASFSIKEITKGDAEIVEDLNKENLFIHNKFLENITTSDSTVGTETNFNFGFGLSDISFENALNRFGYVGNCAKLTFSTVSNGGLIIFKNDFADLPSYNSSLTCNVEIYTPVTCSGTFRIYQDGVQKGSNISFNFSVGVNTVNIPLTAFDDVYDYVWLRFFPSASAWNSQSIYWGRTYLSGVKINSNELQSSIKEIYQNQFDNSSLIKQLRTDLTPFSLPYWNGKKVTVLGDSITSQNTWQPEVSRAIGCIITSQGVGGSMVTPYITGLAGQTAENSMYFRADAVDLTNPDLILFFGSQNDNLTSMGGDIPLGLITDTPYSGAEVTSPTTPPSFYASYMGTVEKLCTQNPLATVILITPLWSGDQTYVIKKTKTDAIEEIGKLYCLRVINLLEDSGINAINQTSFISDTVHPNTLGGQRIGSLVSNYLR